MLELHVHELRAAAVRYAHEDAYLGLTDENGAWRRYERVAAHTTYPQGFCPESEFRATYRAERATGRKLEPYALALPRPKYGHEQEKRARVEDARDLRQLVQRIQGTDR